MLSGKGHAPQRWGEIQIIYTSALLERARKVDFNGIRFRQTRFINSHLRPAGSTVIIAFQAMTRPLLRLQMGRGRAPNAITRSAQHLTAATKDRAQIERYLMRVHMQPEGIGYLVRAVFSGWSNFANF